MNDMNDIDITFLKNNREKILVILFDYFQKNISNIDIIKKRKLLEVFERAYISVNYIKNYGSGNINTDDCEPLETLSDLSNTCNIDEDINTLIKGLNFNIDILHKHGVEFNY